VLLLYSIVGSCVIEYEQMILAIEAFPKGFFVVSVNDTLVC